MRTVIVGNSGSGKTWLAMRLAEIEAVQVLHLDDIFWLPGGFNQKRDPAEVLRIIDAARVGENWIAEGVFGNLAAQFLRSADTLVWLDLPWTVCRERLELRGSESKAHMDRGQSEAGLRELMQWAQDYATRRGSSGYVAHLNLFESCNGKRLKLCSESQVLDYLAAA